MTSIKKNFVYNSFYQILTLIIPLITTPYISRILGVNGVGIYSYSFSVAQYYALFILLGLNNYGNRTIAKNRDDADKLKKIFWSIYAMQFILGIAVICIYSIYVLILSNNKLAALIMGIYVISECFDINWFFFGMENFKLTTMRNTIVKTLTTAAIFIFVNDQNDVYIYCFIMVIGILISQIVLWPYALKVCGRYVPTWPEIKVHIKPNLVLFLTVIAVSLFKIMDKIMLGFMTSTEQVGLYESSERVIVVPTALVSALGTVMLPRLANLRDNKKESEGLLYKSILFAMFLSSSMSFGIMAVSKTFVTLFYGPGYESCVDLYIILLPSCLFFAFGNVIRTQYLLPNEIDDVYVKSAFIGSAVNIIVNVILIPKMASVGAAIGTLIAEAVVCSYQAFKIRKNINIKKYLMMSFPFVSSGLIMYIVIFNLHFYQENEIVKLLLEVLLGIVLYFVSLTLQLGVGYKILGINWLE